MNKEIEKIFIELIQRQLDLPNNYGKDDKGNVIPCVCIKAQNIKLFNTDKLQITVSTLSSNVYSNRTETKEIIKNNQEHFVEETYLNERRSMQIDVYSRNNEARQRFPEVQAALSSTLAEQLQDKYQFRIGKISQATNTSGLDGGSDINRYTIRFDCLSWFKVTKDIDYYDTFRTQARNTNDNIFADFIIEQGE